MHMHLYVLYPFANKLYFEIAIHKLTINNKLYITVDLRTILRIIYKYIIVRFYQTHAYYQRVIIEKPVCPSHNHIYKVAKSLAIEQNKNEKFNSNENVITKSTDYSSHLLTVFTYLQRNHFIEGF